MAITLDELIETLQVFRASHPASGSAIVFPCDDAVDVVYEHGSVYIRQFDDQSDDVDV